MTPSCPTRRSSDLEGGPSGFVNAMGPFNAQPEPIEAKLAALDSVGGPGTHSNFPWGWAMAANTPLRRYKQNTHGGGIRSEEHTSELQSQMRNSYACVCLKKKNNHENKTTNQ